MRVLISMVIPLVQMLTRNSTADEYGRIGRMSVVSMYYGLRYDIRKIPPNCEDNEYEVTVRVGSLLWSGTDDKVEIRLYGPNDNKSYWIELAKPAHDDFERMSTEFYCVNQPNFDIKKIGIRKLGNDNMYLSAIYIRDHYQYNRYFNVDQWIKEDAREYIFQAD